MTRPGTIPSQADPGASPPEADALTTWPAIRLRREDIAPCLEIRKCTRITDIIEYILKQKMEMGRTYGKNKRQPMDKALHRVAAKEREKMKRTTKQKGAG